MYRKLRQAFKPSFALAVRKQKFLRFSSLFTSDLSFADTSLGLSGDMGETLLSVGQLLEDANESLTPELTLSYKERVPAFLNSGLLFSS